MPELCWLRSSRSAAASIPNTKTCAASVRGGAFSAARRATPNPSTRTSPFLPSRLLNFLWLFGVPPTKVDAVVKVQGDRKQTAHLQTALLHPVGWRTQIRTAQPGSIPSTWLGAESATQG